MHSGEFKINDKTEKAKKRKRYIQASLCIVLFIIGGYIVYRVLAKKDTDSNSNEPADVERNFSLSDVDWPRAESDGREF